MSIEEELQRQLHTRASAVRATPDLADLSGRIRTRESKATRRERFALGVALVVLAGSVGGLAGALVSRPAAKAQTSVKTGFNNGGGSGSSGDKGKTAPKEPTKMTGTTPRVAYSKQSANGMTLTAEVEQLASPVAITGAFSSSVECTTGELVFTTVGQSGSFGGGTSVAGLPALQADGLEILSSGDLQVSGGGEAWWVTVAVGAKVARVAAEDIGGSIVGATPSDGIAVIAGTLSGASAGAVQMSAVAEMGDGQPVESMGFLLGSGPMLAGGPDSAVSLKGCSVMGLKEQPSSASASQPADPSLAGASVIGAFEQAYSANQYLGFAANLAAVNDGGRLTSPVSSPASVGQAAATPSGGSLGLVDVHQVSFISASTADVVYSVSGGVMLSGTAQLGASGIWKVSLPTFCGDVLAGAIAEVPAGVSSACEADL